VTALSYWTFALPIWAIIATGAALAATAIGVDALCRRWQEPGGPRVEQ